MTGSAIATPREAHLKSERFGGCTPDAAGTNMEPQYPAPPTEPVHYVPVPNKFGFSFQTAFLLEYFWKPFVAGMLTRLTVRIGGQLWNAV